MAKFRAKVTSGGRIQMLEAVRESEKIDDGYYVGVDVERIGG